LKITLKRDKSIRGSWEKKGTIVEVGDLVAQVLIDNGDAIKFREEEITPKIKKTKVEN
tara:strand:+ start:240 stop:413 length:174 start_codon:yes stop_codon:yes gene_type:complete